ncbi:acyl-CoA N-acyltransferase, partial [Crucibulum laeve]
MPIANSYKPPCVDSIDIYQKNPFDVNCNIPVPTILETNRVKLIPFIPSLHGEPFINAFNTDPNMGRYLPVSFPTVVDFLTLHETFIRSDPGSVWFTIIDKTKPDHDNNLGESVAGVIGVLHSSPVHRTIEIGPVMVLPAFQRTFVSSNAIGLLLNYLLDTQKEGGLGFRRVVWCTNPFNEPSVRAAERLGFVKEGTMRWSWILPTDKKGHTIEEGSERGEGDGRDSVVLAICWDNWEDGVKAHVKMAMDRV